MRKILIALILITLIIPLSAYEFKVKNSFRTSSRFYENRSNNKYLLDFNYHPELYLRFNRSRHNIYPQLDLEIDYDCNYSYFETEHETESNLHNEFYRYWIRYSEEYREIRLGLQQINFGTAMIFRPLKWFDTLDPRDETKRTEGMHAFLFKKYYRNNANLWCWIIVEEDKINRKFFQDDLTDKLNFGGRIQYPFTYCTVGISYHQRAKEEFLDDSHISAGLDVRWDSIIGYWIESSMEFYRTEHGKLYGRYTTLGADYTIPIGSGIYIVTEHLLYTENEKDFYNQNDEAGNTALMINYPLSLFDNLRGIVNYNWRHEEFYYFLSLSRVYDILSITLNFYWNPLEENSEPVFIEEMGKSIELVLEMNF